MRCNPKSILRLLKEVEEITRLTLVHGNFTAMHDRLEAAYKEQSQKKLPFLNGYLYRKLYLPVKDGGTRQVNLSLTNLNAISVALGYEDYSGFERSEHAPVNKVLEKCKGEWYSYVRCNSGNPDVLVSPVRIYGRGKTILMFLQGKARKFTGEMKLKGKCIYCVLESEGDKQIHLVLKVGLSDSPDVLQGVFSGISSGEDPIAGREILARQDMPFEKMKNDKLKIETLCASDNEKEKIIGNYFRERDRNILSAGKSSTFTFSDLHEEAGRIKRKTR